MAITRRQFIKRSGLVAAGGLVGGGLFRNPWVQQAFAETIGDRYLVVLFLDGGNDGLNTVTPSDDGDYGALRAAYQSLRDTGNGGIQLKTTELTATAIDQDPLSHTPLALHPGLIGLKNLYDLGKVRVIQGCGYPDYSLSHEVARRIWQSGNPAGVPGYSTGWVGRHLALEYGGSDIPAVTIQGELAGEFLQTATSVLAIRRLQRFKFPYDEFDGADDGAKETAFRALCNGAKLSDQGSLKYLGNVGTATIDATESYPQASQLYVADRPTYDQSYDDLQVNGNNNGLARDLREVAKVIWGVENGLTDVNARFFQVRSGGYDTHSDQGGAGTTGQHYSLHREVGDAIENFYADLDTMNISGKVSDKICIVVWSEFSRRVQQNENGTDHGSQGPMFVIGGKVNGGVTGNHPNLNSLDSDGNTKYSQAGAYRSTDFRDVFGTILEKWFNMDHNVILNNVLALDSGPAADYWTQEDFSLPLFVP